MDGTFNLRERTTLIVGELTPTVQHLMTGLTQLGSDVVLVNKESVTSAKFCQLLTDSREVNAKFGRALSVSSPLATLQEVKDAVGVAAQSFGSVDLYVDFSFSQRLSRYGLGQNIDYLQHELHSGLVVPIWFSHTVLNFLKSRKRGRILFLMNGLEPDPLVQAAKGSLKSFVQSMAPQVSEFNITMNVLSLGLTEEFVMSMNPEAKSIREAVDKLKVKNPAIKITEPDRITNTILYLASQYGGGISGQTLELT